jgi:hypothetical protein
MKLLPTIALTMLIGQPLAVRAQQRRASDVDLSWSAPASCPNRESLRDGLVRRLGRPVRIGPDAAVSLSGVITAVGQGYSLALRTRAGDVSEQRTLQARSCGELARASLLVLSLLLVEGRAGPGDPAEVRVADGATPPALEAERPPLVAARARAVFDLGTLQRIAVGPALAVGLDLGVWQLELAGLYLLPQALRARSSQQQVGELGLWAGSASVCAALTQRPLLAPCVTFELGRLFGRGTDALTRPESVGGSWLLGQIGLRFGVALGRGWSWQSELSAGVPWNRWAVASHALGEVYRVPSVIARLHTGLELRL